MLKRILNSGTLAVMFLGTGPFFLLLWLLGFDGSNVFWWWIGTGIAIKVYFSSTEK